MHSKKTVAVPPGATIRDQLENRGMSQKDFALHMGMTEKHISRLINGEVQLTPDVSLRLENVLGISADFWGNLEARYQLKLARVKKELEDEQEEEFVAKFPYAKLARGGWLPKTNIIQERILNLRNFFEVAKLDIINSLKIPGIAFRRVNENNESDYTSAVWAQKAKLEARKVETAPINIQKLKKEINQIRELSILDASEFGGKLKNILADCGVAIVFLPHISGSFMHGASFLDGKKIILGLTVRGRDADIFWFSLFHELFHIIDGHISKPEGANAEDEIMANDFAKDILICPKAFEEFINFTSFNESDIVRFAKENSIDPGIVLGRLQKEQYVRYDQFRNLRTQIEIVQ